MIGIIGLPSRSLLERFRGEDIVDLDCPLQGALFDDVVESRCPKIFCAVLTTCFTNAMIVKPDVILADVGPGKCEGARYLCAILHDLLPSAKIIAEENLDSVPRASSNCECYAVPLRERMERIVDKVIRPELPDFPRSSSSPKAGFWGVPPSDFAILEGFPNETIILGWSRCMDSRTPADLKLEMEAPPNIPVVFFAQSFCQKSILARTLAEKHQGLFVECDEKVDNSTIQKIEAFLKLRGAL
ncbi:hypothetical protein HQ563_15065 [bacterium]|nr:hypothetical protein [bacterium]